MPESLLVAVAVAALLLGMRLGEMLERRRASLEPKDRQEQLHQVLQTNRELVGRMASSFDNVTYGVACMMKGEGMAKMRGPVQATEQTPAAEPETDRGTMDDAEFRARQKGLQQEISEMFGPEPDLAVPVNEREP